MTRRLAPGPFLAAALAVIGIAVEDGVEAVGDFAKAHTIDYRVLVAGDGGIPPMQALRNTKSGLPFTIDVDRQGRIVAGKIGAMNPAELQAAAAAALTSPEPNAQEKEPAMSAPREPTLEALSNPGLRYFAATRPAFLSVTFVGVLLGLASAAAGGVRIDPALATVTLFFALVAHAGANVINDYYDALSGCDAANTGRVFPFTGGSRFIQNGVLTTAATGRFGHALLLAVVPAGLWLTAVSGPGLILVGLAGLLVGWAYSAPPFRLQSRGLGEFGITLAWLLVVVGTDFVQRHAFAFGPAAAGLGFALLVASVLYINQFPDIDADAQAGKRTLIVRLGPAAARWGYVALVALAYVWVGALALAGRLPMLALLSLVPVAANAAAIRNLWPNAGRPAELAPAIKLTILAASLHGLLLAVALVLAH